MNNFIYKLQKLANKLDEKGYGKQANKIDKVIKKIAGYRDLSEPVGMAVGLDVSAGPVQLHKAIESLTEAFGVEKDSDLYPKFEFNPQSGEIRVYNKEEDNIYKDFGEAIYSLPTFGFVDNKAKAVSVLSEVGVMKDMPYVSDVEGDETEEYYADDGK